jgi:hypothetical protein
MPARTAMAATSAQGAGYLTHHPLTLFAAGAIAVLVFHQGLITVLHLMGLANAPFQTAPTEPFGVPRIWSAAFWGGLWGIAFGFAARWFPRGALYWLAAFVFGALAPTLVGWFVVAPIRGQALGYGFVPSRMGIGLLIHGVWGLGTALILRWRG